MLPNVSDVMQKFGTQYWSVLHAEPRRAYNADCPTLKEVAMLFDYPVTISRDGSQIDNMGAYWIQMQLTYLFCNSNCKDASVVSTIEPFSRIFAAEVKNFKLTELMLFFSRYMLGDLDDSYSSFSTKGIGLAFKKFRVMRDEELRKIEREKNSAERSEKVEYPDCFENSLVWAKHLIHLAEIGNSLAAILLTPPNGETSAERMRRVYAMADSGDNEAKQIITNGNNI